MKKIFLLTLFVVIGKTGLFAQASGSVNKTTLQSKVISDSAAVRTAHAVVTDDKTGAVLKEYDLSVTPFLLLDQKPYLSNDSILVPKKKEVGPKKTP
jgi:hypothetical protein